MKTQTELSPEYRLLRFMNDYDGNRNHEKYGSIKGEMRMADADFEALFQIFVDKNYIIDQDRSPGCWRITTDGQKRLTEMQHVVDYERSIAASNQAILAAQEALSASSNALDLTKTSKITSIINACVTIVTSIIMTCAIVQQCNQGERQNELLEQQNKLNKTRPAKKERLLERKTKAVVFPVQKDSAKPLQKAQPIKDSTVKKLPSKKP